MFEKRPFTNEQKLLLPELCICTYNIYTAFAISRIIYK